MADSKPKMRRAHVQKKFKDVGTGKSFEAGKRPMITEGEFLNYAAAGLIKDPDADKAEESSD